MAEVFSNAKREAVYYCRGNFKDSTEKRFIKAPFDILMLQGGQYLMPVAPACNANMALLQYASADLETRDLWREDFAYHDLKPVTLWEHEMGDVSNPAEATYGNWKSVHRFAPL